MANNKFNDPKIREKVVSAITAGLPMTTAAGLAKIRRETLWQWIKTGNDDRAMGAATPFAQFSEDVEFARACATEKALEYVNNAMSTEYKAATWYLERAERDAFGPVQKLEVSQVIDQDAKDVDAQIIGILEGMGSVTSAELAADLRAKLEHEESLEAGV